MKDDFYIASDGTIRNKPIGMRKVWYWVFNLLYTGCMAETIEDLIKTFVLQKWVNADSILYRMFEKMGFWYYLIGAVVMTVWYGKNMRRAIATIWIPISLQSG